MTESADRRPLASRSQPWAVAAAAWLIRHRASPDGISLAGMAAGIAAGLCLAFAAAAPTVLFLSAAVLVQCRLLANLFDGMVAVGRGIASPLGELFNEVPDRVSDTAILAGLGWGAGCPALGLAAALAAMATAYVRAVGRGLGQSSDFSGPMAKQHRMAVVTVLSVVCALLPAPAWLVPGVLWAITILATATALRRLLHIARALRA